ncbi:MAG: hypothetical protein L6R40_007870 [Gallowayella cf. fulva]|nr:MAG: hypothetical protein L6R40_007870 [Xanthomendoza cf. fulva]
MTPYPETAPPLSIVILGTCDTKLDELLFLRSHILSHAEHVSITLVDVGNRPVSDPAISIPQHDLLARFASASSSHRSNMPRADLMRTMTEAATTCLDHLYSETTLHGVIAIGGSGGTSLTSAAMRRALPFLLPKLIVSTVASGDTAPFVGETDITLMYSIVDIAGSNSILDGVLQNAAGAIVGMARAFQKRQLSQLNHDPTHPPEARKKKKKKKIGITMFGVTTPCVDAIRRHLAATFDSEMYIFHATGHGGRAMERLISSGGLDAILDLTTSEIADEIVGGVMSAGPRRLEAALEAGIPTIISVGACDIVNFGVRNTVPRKFVDEGRELYEHNASVTLVRTNPEECMRIGAFIVEKLRGFCKRPHLVQVVLPTGGISPLSKPGEVYANEKADDALFGAIEEGLKGTKIEVIRDAREVNDEGFAMELADRLVRRIKVQEESVKE